MFRRFAFLAVLAAPGVALLPPTADSVAVAQTIGSGCVNCGQARITASHSRRVQSDAASSYGAQAKQSAGRQRASSAEAHGIRLAPGERLLSVSPIGSTGQVVVDGGAAVSSRPSTGATGRSGTSNVLDVLNNQRARQGLASLSPDAALQAVAERRVQQMAASGNKNHPPGSFAPGSYEGVGWSSSFSPSAVSACYTDDPRMRFAGAAMAVGRDGVYFAVVYR